MTTLASLIGATAAVALAVAVPSTADAAVTWTIQSVPLPPGEHGGWLSGVSCPTATFCMAVAASGADVGGFVYPAIETWNGSAWTAQALTNDRGGTVTAVSCGTTTSCVAIGNTFSDFGEFPMLAEIWNGTTWTAETIPQVKTGLKDGSVHAVSCSSATNCTAVGRWDTGGTQSVAMPLAERWNGTTWMQQNPVSVSDRGTYLYGISCPATSACTAVGLNAGAVTGGGSGPLIERWNGGKWHVQYNTPGNDTLDSVSCTTPSACVAAGIAVNGTAASAVPVAMRSNLGGWGNPVTMPIPSSANSAQVSSVSCVMPSGSTVNCTAVGLYNKPANSANFALAEFFNGHHWAVQPTARAEGRKLFYADSCAPGTSVCEAVGRANVVRNSDFQILAERN